MKFLASLLATALVSVPAFAASAHTNVGVAVEIGEPGFYGRIILGNAPPPVLIYAEPVIIVHPHIVRPPIYMHVPPGHARHWKDHCASYGACGRRVYFVRDEWYEDVYVPHYRKHHKGKGNGKGKGNRGDD